MAKFNVGDKVITSRGYTFDGKACEVVSLPNKDGEYLIASPTYPNNMAWPVKESEMKDASVNPRASRASHPVNRKVLDHLKSRKTISPMEALMTYGISRLAPAIHDLRAAGHSIKSEMHEDAKGHRYARYTLTQLAA